MMYPAVRMLWQLYKHRNDGPLGFLDTHESEHYCLPWDLDLWMELNNGRTLTLYDLGRVPLGRRNGLAAAVRRRGWTLTVAGSSVRYRQRITAFEKIRMRSRSLGWDARFIYSEQSMWKMNGDCAGHVLIRTAVPGPAGIISPIEVAKEMGITDPSPALPDWVAAWVAADARRPWPPMQD
jgi:acyl-CoA thioesterase FadM